VSTTYIRAVAQLDWLLEPLEEYLQRTRDLAAIDTDYMRLLAFSRQPSDDEILAALEALSSLRVLRRYGSIWQLDYAYFNETAS
jgi:hypothetical protein